MFFKNRNIFISTLLSFIIIFLVISFFSCRHKVTDLRIKSGTIGQKDNEKMEKPKSPIDAKFVEITKPEIGKKFELSLKIMLEVDCENVTVKFKYPKQLEDSKTKKELILSLKRNSEVSIPQTFLIPDDKRYIVDAFIDCKIEGNTKMSRGISYVIDLGEKEEVDKDLKVLDSKNGEKLNVHFVK